MYQRSDVREGMTVRSVDGEKLGKVFAVNEDGFLIEKGLFFPKDYVCRYPEISRLEDGDIILLHGKEGLHRFLYDGVPGGDVLAGTGGGAGVGPGALGMDSRGQTARATVPLPVVEEEAVIRRQAFEENQDIDATVRRERVDIDGAEDSRTYGLETGDPLLRR
jgi:hypothetical protein